MHNMFTLKQLHNSSTYRYLATGYYFTDLHLHLQNESLYDLCYSERSLRHYLEGADSGMYSATRTENSAKLLQKVSRRMQIDLPNCIGIVDGKNIIVVKLLDYCTSIINIFSIVLIVVAASDYRFV